MLTWYYVILLSIISMLVIISTYKFSARIQLYCVCNHAPPLKRRDRQRVVLLLVDHRPSSSWCCWTMPPGGWGVKKIVLWRRSLGIRIIVWVLRDENKWSISYTNSLNNIHCLYYQIGLFLGQVYHSDGSIFRVSWPQLPISDSLLNQSTKTKSTASCK